MPPTTSAIRKILGTYSLAYGNESIDGIRNFVENTPSAPQLYDRKNFNGHITASALIFDHGHRLLVISHAVFKRFLQPGGHVEPGDISLLNAALRETAEETNLHEHDLVFIPLLADATDVPFHIDSHEIPLNATKNEPAHYHHDFGYLFYYKGSGSIKADLNETDGFTWLQLDETNKIGLPSHKLKHYLQAHPDVY